MAAGSLYPDVAHKVRKVGTMVQEVEEPLQEVLAAPYVRRRTVKFLIATDHDDERAEKMPLSHWRPPTANKRAGFKRRTVSRQLVEYCTFDIEGESVMTLGVVVGEFERRGNVELIDAAHGIQQVPSTVRDEEELAAQKVL